MRVVFDTNVWISGLLWGGTPKQAIDLARWQQVRVCASASLLEELAVSLSRPKLQRRLSDWGYTAEFLVAVVWELVEICPVATLEVPELRDPKDVYILGTAIAAKAEAIVTGDQDLLVLGEFAEIAILTPIELLDRLS